MSTKLQQPATAGQWVALGRDIWYTRKLFPIAKDEKGLPPGGIKQRLVDGFKSNPWIVDPDANMSASTPAQVEEEKEMMKAVEEGQDVDLPLDTTMTVVRMSNNRVLLHNTVPYDDTLGDQVADMGHVNAIVAPNLRHWMFIKQWAERFPEATIYIAPEAHGESLVEKLGNYVDKTRLHNLEACDPFDESLKHRLLKGAAYKLNEVLFFHEPSKTLLASDTFYGGYQPDDPFLSWFARVWFKMSKGSWQSDSLPSYRVDGVNDADQVLKDVNEIVKSWDFEQIVFAHGSIPYKHNAKEMFQKVWLSGLEKE